MLLFVFSPLAFHTIPEHGQLFYFRDFYLKSAIIAASLFISSTSLFTMALALIASFSFCTQSTK